MDIQELESATGIVVSVGGQLPQNIALRLQETGVSDVSLTFSLTQVGCTFTSLTVALMDTYDCLLDFWTQISINNSLLSLTYFLEGENPWHQPSGYRQGRRQTEIL
jgi:hypothetical protein